MPAPNHKLTTAEMARFVADGYLRFDALIPDEINRPIIEELRQLEANKINQIVGLPMEDGGPQQPASLTPLSECYPEPSLLGALLRLPEVQGIIDSLVGPDPLFDHDFVHRLPAGSDYKQYLHVDAVIDSADPTFDIQLFYYPGDVAEGAVVHCTKAGQLDVHDHLVGCGLVDGGLAAHAV